MGQDKQPGWLKKRKKPAPETQKPEPEKFVYSRKFVFPGISFENIFNSDFTFIEKIISHRIVKVTKKRIFIESNVDKPKCFTLNKEVFERNGKCWAGGEWWAGGELYYKDKKMIPLRDNKDLLNMFDIKGDLTKESLRTAYRKKAKELHPDKGGDAEAFMELKEAYETAINLVG